MSAKTHQGYGKNQGGWQIKRVTSSTGPMQGTLMTDAIRNTASVPGQTKILWAAPKEAGYFLQLEINYHISISLLCLGGWMPGHSYRVKLIHRPKIDLIRAKVWESNKTIADSGNVIDIGTDALKGGRLGVYCDSQELVTWSALSYRYILDTHIQ